MRKCDWFQLGSLIGFFIWIAGGWLFTNATIHEALSVMVLWIMLLLLWGFISEYVIPQ